MERSGFFASQNNDRLYTDDEFASYFGRFLQDGYFPTEDGDGLQVKADGSNILKVTPGSAWVQGRCYELLDYKELEIEIGDALLSRIDRVVLRCDYVERNIYVTIKKGQESSSPVAPELTRNEDAYELGLCYYKIEKGATNLVQSNIVDTRKDITVCGEVTSIIDKHSLKEFLKDTGFSMKGDMYTENIMPNGIGKEIGSATNRYKKIYTQDIDISGGIPYLPLVGGEMSGDISAKNIIPSKNNASNLGSSENKWANAYINNLNVYGTHPFINRTGGAVDGAIEYTSAPISGKYHTKYNNFDGATQGDGHTYIGYNSNGLCSHMFRGLGNFTVDNPTSTFKDVKADSFMLNGKRIYIQSDAPVNAPEGSVWIKI